MGRRTMRIPAVLLLSAGAGVVTALVVSGVTAPTRPPGTLNFWGAVFGLAVTAVVAAAAGVVVTRRARGALQLLASVLVLLGGATLVWNLVWGIRVDSLEGAWLWPVAILPLAAGGLVAWLAGRQQHDPPV